MAIAFVRNTQSGTSGSAVSTIGFGVASTAGNALILQVATATSRTGNAGESYASVISNISGTVFNKIISSSIFQSGEFYESSQIWAAFNVPAGNHQITINVGGSNVGDYGQLFLSEFSGIAAASAVDVIAAKYGDTSQGLFNTSITTSTASNPNELVLASFDIGSPTGLSNYFDSGIVTPEGFTSLGYDPNARLGNRGYSQSYKIVSSTVPQTISWGVINDPGPDEKIVWAASVAKLKAATAATLANGVVVSGAVNFISGQASAFRRASVSGLVLASTTSLSANNISIQRNAIAQPFAASIFDDPEIATSDQTSGYTADNTFGPTFDQTNGQTFDAVDAPVGTFFAQANFIPGTAVGVSVNILGSLSFLAPATLTTGTATASRRASATGQTNLATAGLTVGAVVSRRFATPAIALIAANSSIIAAQTSSFENAIISSFVLSVQSSLPQSNPVISAQKSAVPAGVAITGQSSFVLPTVSSLRSATFQSVVLSSQAFNVSGAPSVVLPGAVPGNIFARQANLIVGSVVSQTAKTVSGITLASASSFVAGSVRATVNAATNSAVLEAAAQIVLGGAQSEKSIVAGGYQFFSQAVFVAGSRSTGIASTQNGIVFSYPVVFVSGLATAQKLASPINADITSYAFLSGGAAVGGKNSNVAGRIFTAATNIISSDFISEKSSITNEVILKVNSSLIGGNIVGKINSFHSSELIIVTSDYILPAADSFQNAIRAQHNFLNPATFIAGQVTGGADSQIPGAILNSSATIQDGGIVYFAAVTILSQTIAAQAAALAGVSVGKQLNRRNTGGKAMVFLQEFLEPITGHSLIITDQNGPRPIKPYATLGVRAISEQPINEFGLNSNGTINLAKLQRLTVEVEYYGVGAYGKAQTLGLKLNAPSQVLRADEFGLSVSQIRSVTRVPELLNQSQYEERAILEFTVYIMVEGDDQVGLIEHAIIQDTDSDHACVFDFVYKGSN